MAGETAAAIYFTDAPNSFFDLGSEWCHVYFRNKY